MNDTYLNKPAFTLTIGELVEALKTATNSEYPVAINPQPEPLEQKFEYSSRDASRRLGISPPTFHAWKNKKLFTYTQIGRKCIYDIPLIRQELKEVKNKKSR